MKIYMLLLIWLLVYTGSTPVFNDGEKDVIKNSNRHILQESDPECTLTNNQISNYYDEATNTWSISSADLTDDLENDIQSIFDCASDGDYVMFNTENTIIPDDTISISKNLTISFFTDSIESENGAFPETETKVVFNCPEDKAIFNIESATVTLANIEISQCDLSKQAATSPILFSYACTDDDYVNDGTVRLHHVNFINNKNHDQGACFSSNSIVCSSLEIINARFEENESGGYVLGNLLPITTMTDVTISNNRFLRGKTFDMPATLMTSNENEELIISNLNAHNNTGLILAIRNGIANIESSTCEDNTGSLMSPVLPACIAGTETQITITDSTFSRVMPIFVDVVESTLEISGCLFQNLNGNGIRVGNYSGITTRDSDLVVENSNFYYNNGYDTAGAIKNDNSNVKIDNSIFFANTGQRGGALFVECQIELCTVNVTNSYFVANTGYYIGGAIRLLSDYEADISNSVFYQNSAYMAGAIATTNYVINTITISDSTFLYHTANFSFSAVYLSAATGGLCIGKINNCTIQNSNCTGAFGGGLTGWSASIEVNGGIISNNTGLVDGGGIVGVGSEITLNGVQVSDNVATNYGGGIHLEYNNAKSNITINNSTIERNSCGINGGGIYCQNGCNINITNSELSYNQAGSYGGAISTVSALSNTIIYIEDSRGFSNVATIAGFYSGLTDFSVNIINSEISDNTASSFGGALFLEDSSKRSNFTISGSTFNRNIGMLRGSTILTNYYLDGYITNSVFRNNTSSDMYGGVVQTVSGTWQKNQTLSDLGYYTPYLRLMAVRERAGTTFLNADDLLIPMVTLVMENNEFSGNSAGVGLGAIFYSMGGTLLDIKNCSFTDNYSSQNANINLVESEFYCEDCVFTNNQCAEYASVIQLKSSTTEGVSPNSTLYLKNSIFSENSAGGQQNEGTVAISNSRMIMENSNFSTNVAPYGGAMSFRQADISISDSLFMSNSGSLGGGALFIGENTIVTIENSSFESNEVTSELEAYGGAVYALSQLSFSNLTFSKCSFVSNSIKGSGGALHLEGLFIVSISDTQFKNNEVSMVEGRGGGFVAIGQQWKLNETDATNPNVMYSNEVRSAIQEDYGVVGVSRDNGFPSFELKFENILFEENKANEAQTGALHLENGVLADLTNCTFTKNTGSSNGAMHILNSEAYFNKCSFIENQANDADGGAVGLYSNYAAGNATTEISFAVFKDSKFESNKAAGSGGAIVLDNENIALYILENNEFTMNSAENGGVIRVNDRGYVYCSGSSFIDNEADEKGGALDIYIEENEGLKYYLKNCPLIGNKANIGGAIHLFEHIEMLEFCTTSENECPDMVSIYLNDLEISGNSAKTAGGAIMISNPYIIDIECENDEKEVNFEIEGGFENIYTQRNSKDSFLNGEMCENWEKNTVSKDGYGETNATYARDVLLEAQYNDDTIAIFSDAIENETNTTYNVTGLKSGQNLPSLLLTTIDGFNKGPAYIEGKDLSVTMYSPDDLFAGSIEYNMNEGQVTVNSIQLIGEYGVRNVHLNFSLETFKIFELQVNLRECVIGEEYREEATFCILCDIFEYNFNPMTQTCSDCPENANCGGNAIEPNDGYWHISPCSPYINKCIAEVACRKDSRDYELYIFSQNLTSCNLSESDYEYYGGLQCQKGYTGPLCGACDKNYGKMSSFECSECSGLGYIYAFFVISGIWFLVLTGIGIKGNLDSKEHEFRSDKDASGSDTEGKNQDNDQNQANGQGKEERVEERVEERNDGEGDDVNIRGELPQEDGVGPSSSIHRGEEIEEGAFSPTHHTSLTGKINKKIYNEKNCLIKKRTITETFKVAINYLQVTAIAIAINIDWTKSMETFLSALDFIGGISGATTIVSLDCILNADYNVEKSIIRVILSFIWPVFILLIVIFIWYVHTFLLKRKGIKMLIRRSLLTCVVVSYLAYINVTKSLVKVLYCDNVNDSKDYFTFGNSRKLWLEDTTIECYVGDHLWLAVFVIILIVLFPIGYPIAVSIYLMVKRKTNQLHKKWVYETMGFLYRAYKHKYVFWDAIIMARKGILAAIVVFGYPLGGNLQGILAVFALILALSANMIIRPFKKEYRILNWGESASLFVSTITFTAGLLFNDDQSGDALKILTAVILISLNTSLITAFLCTMIYSGFMYFKIKLVLDGSSKVGIDDNVFDVMKKGFKHAYKSNKPKAVRVASKLKKSLTFSSHGRVRKSQSTTKTESNLN